MLVCADARACHAARRAWSTPGCFALAKLGLAMTDSCCRNPLRRGMHSDGAAALAWHSAGACSFPETGSQFLHHALVPEMPDAGEHHGDVMRVGRPDHLLVTHRTAK